MKRTAVLLLAVIMLMTTTPSAFADSVTAVPTASRIYQDGMEKTFDAYNINGNNYFKLRDIAYVLSNTQKQFELTWDKANNAIHMTIGLPYTPVGGEMSAKGTESKLAVTTSSRIYLNGVEISLTAYNIDGNNYFKMRDIAKVIDLFLGWDGSVIYLITSKGYDYSTEGINITVTPADSATIKQSLRNGMTRSEFEQAYDAALKLVKKYSGMSRDLQLRGIYAELRYLTETVIEYTSSQLHYNDVYGFFILNRSSCAGATRAVGLCLTILGIPYEHVNENQWSHQWCRVEFDGEYWICDAFGMYVGAEPAPYRHPWL